MKFHLNVFVRFDDLLSKLYALDKLDGVGPVDNRPSTDKLSHFVKRKRKKERKKVTLVRLTIRFISHGRYTVKYMMLV